MPRLFIIGSFLVYSNLFIASSAKEQLQDGISHFEAAESKYFADNEDEDKALHHVLNDLVTLRNFTLSQFNNSIHEGDFVHGINSRHLQATNGVCNNVAPEAPKVELYANWMKAIESPELVKITDLTLPGSHDAGTFPLNTDFNYNSRTYKKVKRFTRFLGEKLVARVICKLAQAQDQTVATQLVGGMRYLDLRVDWDDKKSAYRVHHTLFGETIQQVMQTVADFLKTHQSEILVLEMTQMWSTSVTNAQRVELRQSIIDILGPYLCPKTASGEIEATIAEMRLSNQRVLVAIQDSVVSNHTSLWSLNVIHNTHAGTPNVTQMVEFNTERMEEFSEELIPAPFYKISWTLTPNSGYIARNVFGKRGLYSLAMTANEKFPEFVKEHPNQKLGEIIIIDFFEHTPFMKLLGIPSDSDSVRRLRQT